MKIESGCTCITDSGNNVTIETQYYIYHLKGRHIELYAQTGKARTQCRQITYCVYTCNL